MSSPTNPSPSPLQSPPDSEASPPLWKITLGAGIAGAIAYFTLQLLQSMLDKLPQIPQDASRFAQSISVLVRYLLLGGVSLMGFMFAAVALGLLVYGLQQIAEKLSPS